MLKCKTINKVINFNLEHLAGSLINCQYSNVAKHKISATAVPPKEARVVICGGGAMGAAVAFHLAKYGWGSDTLLIEQSR